MGAVDIAVSGAGVAGLSAARALREGGARVRLVEAQDEPGRRVRIITHADGLPVTGAELAPAYPGFIDGAVRAGRETAARRLGEH